MAILNNVKIDAPCGQIEFRVSYDLTYCATFYAYVNADLIELSLDKQNYDKIISYGKK
ncbi:hypothetical protein [Halarcobacter anaerophilus]|uniref:hypothetical protein n=1 Tax=Halarcobacter anaerophilus TaxID=877500 RepID=UPI000A76B1DF|nr:hypothetical protein [Halarcobacter anaerophilus]